MTTQADVQRALVSARRSIMLARTVFQSAQSEEGGWGWEVDANIDVHLEDAFLRALAVAEARSQAELKQLILAAYTNGKAKGFYTREEDGDGDEFLPFLLRAETYVGLLEDLYGASSLHAPDARLVGILRNCLYAITDKNCFDAPPSSEAHVHSRIEAVLRCVYPDLLHKPPLAKDVKGFVPDTGLPSIKTLIEYKFISDASRVATIADEILADSRGYVAAQWATVVYVIYETARFRAEHEWNGLLFSSGLGENSLVIVLHGESGAAAGADNASTKKRTGKNAAGPVLAAPLPDRVPVISGSNGGQADDF